MTGLWAKLRALWAGQSQGQGGGYVTVPKGDETLPAAVFAAELQDINTRRQAAGLDTVSGAAPSARLGLAGLALSGGGIRSAAFNLGVVQALDRLGIYRLVDYLSTVSGGGYLGGALSALHAAAPDLGDMDLLFEGVPADVQIVHGQRQGNTIRLSADIKQIQVIAAPSAGDFYSRVSLVFKGEDTAVPGHRVRLVPVADNHDPQATLFRPVVDVFPFGGHGGQTESPALRHLRENSNYLVPKAFLARLRLPGLFLRGLVVNFLILTPWVMAAALLTLWLAGGVTREAAMTTELTVRLNADRHSRWEAADPDAKPQLLTQRVLNLRDSVLEYARSEDMPIPERLAIMNPPAGVVVGNQPGNKAVVMDIAQADRVPVSLVPSFEGTATLELRAWRQADDDVKDIDPVTALHDLSVGWVGQATIWLLLVLALYPVAQHFVSGGLATDWQVRDRATRWIVGGVLLLIGGTAFISAQPLAIYYFDLLGEVHLPGLGDLAHTLVAGGASASALGALSSGIIAAKASGALRRIGMALFGAMGPLTVWLAYLMVARWLIVPETAPRVLLDAAAGLYDWVGSLADWSVLSATLSAWAPAPWESGHWPVSAPHLALAALLWAVLVFVFTYAFYDINATSFHGFYRDRLSRAFLFSIWRRPSTKGATERVASMDDVKLSALSPRGPYHLINVTLNMAAGANAVLRGRRAAFLTLSRGYVGGPVTGYRLTADMEKLDPHLDLGAAVAISGAAAAPNMGRATKGGLTFALTLLNVRLGVWLPHPRLLASAFYQNTALGQAWAALARLMLRASPRYLWKEMLGSMDASARFINVSDGGHLENLGLYELLRRRCRLILVSDAEADPHMIFQGLADAVRLARIDLGLEVKIDIDSLRPSAVAGLSRVHGALGRIEYGNGETGYLIYLKSSLTGDENVYIEKYKAVDATFPHQTTADQFFDEEQFEAYRALGEHVAMSVVGKLPLPSAPTIETITDAIQRSNLVDNTMDDVVRSMP